MQILPWLGASVAGILNLVAFSALCFLGLHCYVLCVLADPGSVPRDFEHDVEDVTSTYIQVLNPPRPPRAMRAGLRAVHRMRLRRPCSRISRTVAATAQAGRR